MKHLKKALLVAGILIVAAFFLLEKKYPLPPTTGLWIYKGGDNFIQPISDVFSSMGWKGIQEPPAKAEAGKDVILYWGNDWDELTATRLREEVVGGRRLYVKDTNFRFGIKPVRVASGMALSEIKLSDDMVDRYVAIDFGKFSSDWQTPSTVYAFLYHIGRPDKASLIYDQKAMRCAFK